MRDRPDAVEPLDPPAGAKVGDRVTAQGQSDGAPDEQLKSKQKVWETLQVCTLSTAAAAAVVNSAARVQAILPDFSCVSNLTHGGACRPISRLVVNE